jgi:predicted porin
LEIVAMKKSLVALAVLGAFSGMAAAQSSVTVFGIVDVAARYIKNDGFGSIKGLSADQQASSRLGFRGVEDLGGGLKAGFWLETSIAPDTGGSDTTRFWGRRSTVSLMGNFGEIRLGRDFTPTFNSYSDYAVFGTNGSGSADIFANDVLSSAGLTGVATTTTRADNQVSYITPNTLGGLYGQISVAAGEGVAGNKYVGGRLGYAAGPLNVSVGYGQTEVTPRLGDDSFQRATLGASYDFGVLKLMAYYIRSEWADRESNIAEIGASVPVGPGIIRASYQMIDKKGAGAYNDLDANRIALGYIHNLSKRTSVYTTVARIDNKNAATGGTFNVSAKNGPTLGISNGGKSTGAELGIRHNF